MIRLTVDWPPSVNNLYRSDPKTGRRFLTARGKAFEEKVAWQVKAMRIQPFAGRISVSLACRPPDNRRRDLDNVLKAVLDALTKGRLWGDDSQVKRIEATMEEPLGTHAARVSVSVMELEDSE